MDPAEKFALVTGASSGIGWHISAELATRDYNIIAVSNQAARLEELKTHLESKYSVSVYLINQDLARENSARLVFDHCESKGLEVEVLVNNAGMLVYGETTGVQYEKANSILQLHVTTPALLCRLFGEKMMAKGKGFILNVSSISSVMPYPTISFYGPTKSFLKNFSRALRTELKPHGINITCLIPGATETSFYDGGDKVSGDKVSGDRVNGDKVFGDKDGGDNNGGDGIIQKWIKLGRQHKPEQVARKAITALFKNHPVCVPGILNKLVMLLAPIIPHSLISLIYKSMRQ